MRQYPLKTFFLFATLIFAHLSYGAEDAVFVKTDYLASHPNAVIVDMSASEQYSRFHLPGAIWVNYSWLIRPNKQKVNLSGGPQYTAFVLSKLGIKPSDDVLIYDDSADLNAARLLWELKKLNHAKVHLLNGGLVQWALEGRTLTQKNIRLNETTYLAPFNHSSKKLTANLEDVKKAIEDDKIRLIDVRSKEEYMGSVKEPRSGHIPTAINWEWSNAVAFEQGYQEKPAQQIQNQLNALGLRDKKQAIILYCNTGHRAARAWATFTNLGYQNVRVYDGSIQEWMINPKNPLKRGTQP